jgi:hypothetical protein
MGRHLGAFILSNRLLYLLSISLVETTLGFQFSALGGTWRLNGVSRRLALIPFCLRFLTSSSEVMASLSRALLS